VNRHCTSCNRWRSYDQADFHEAFATDRVLSLTLAATLSAGVAKADSIQIAAPSRHPTQEQQTKAMDKMEQYVSEQKIAHAE